LLLNPENEVSIFFTGNGILIGQSPLWLLIYVFIFMINLQARKFQSILRWILFIQLSVCMKILLLRPILGMYRSATTSPNARDLTWSEIWERIRH
jgi:hypothetical protein